MIDTGWETGSWGGKENRDRIFFFKARLQKAEFLHISQRKNYSSYSTLLKWVGSTVGRVAGKLAGVPKGPHFATLPLKKSTGSGNRHPQRVKEQRSNTLKH